MGNLAITFDDLSDGERTTFYDHVLSVRNLYDVTDDDVKDLFKRINKYLTPLNSQELRNATYGGPFIKTGESLANDPYWAENGIVTPDNIRRMRDIEFASDLLIGVIHGPQSSNRQSLDQYYEMYEEDDSELPSITRHKRVFDRTLALVQDLLPEIKGTRWKNKTDFYSLFVVMSWLIRQGHLKDPSFKALRSEMTKFANDIALFQKDEQAEVPADVRDYVEAMRRASSDAHRRGTRHKALVAVLSSHFTNQR